MSSLICSRPFYQTASCSESNSFSLSQNMISSSGKWQHTLHCSLFNGACGHVHGLWSHCTIAESSVAGTLHCAEIISVCQYHINHSCRFKYRLTKCTYTVRAVVRRTTQMKPNEQRALMSDLLNKNMTAWHGNSCTTARTHINILKICRWCVHVTVSCGSTFHDSFFAVAILSHAPSQITQYQDSRCGLSY